MLSSKVGRHGLSAQVIHYSISLVVESSREQPGPIPVAEGPS